MSHTQTQISRVAPNHFQVRAVSGFSALDVRINGDHDAAQRAADYLACGLDELLDGIAEAVGRDD